MIKEELSESEKAKRAQLFFIASYLPFIGILWASDKQLENKLYALWYWCASILCGSIAFVKIYLLLCGSL